MVRIVSFFTSIIILLGSFFASFLPDATAPVSQEELYAIEDTVRQYELSDTVYAVDISGFTNDERIAAIALQGIVAKTDPCIYLLMGGAYSTYLSQIENSGKQIIRTDKNGKKWNFKSLVSQFSDFIADGGYVLYANSEFAEGLNAATNFAAAYGWLPIPVSLKESAEECGLTMKKDLSNEEYDYAFQRKYFNELKNSLEKGTVVHVKLEKLGLRDLAIQQGYFCFYTMNDTKGDSFMKDVLKWSGKNTSVLGWCEKEKDTVRVISKSGCHLVAADYCYDCSYLAHFDCNDRFDAPQAKAYTDETKHYVTLVFSDGDNCQWIQNGYGEFHNMMKYFPESKVSWTFSPVLRDFCPSAFDYTASSANENTSFLCGPSGFGYCNPSLLDSDALDLFSTETASAMLKSGLNVLTILDDYSAIKEGRIAKSFDWFSRFDNIDGGILFLDPDRYEAGKGKIWFSNDKPFASVRLSLWSNEGYDGATDEWIRQQADTVNGYPVDINSIDGYSVICIHAWTMNPEAVSKFIGMLDEHVEILSADDFIATVSQNIPHETAVPSK